MEDGDLSWCDLHLPAPGALRGGAGGRAGVHEDPGAETQAEVDRGAEPAHQPGAGAWPGTRVVELQTKVYIKVRNHREGPYFLIAACPL